MATMATIGYGDIVPVTLAEKIFAILWIFLGVSFYTYIIGNILDLIAAGTQRQTRLNQQVTFLDSYLNQWPVAEGRRA